MAEEEIGVVKHYFGHLGVAAIEVTNGQLSINDTIHICGHTTDLTTVVSSMQIEHDSIEKAKKGDAVGIQVAEKVREHDKVFKVVD